MRKKQLTRDFDYYIDEGRPLAARQHRMMNAETGRPMVAPTFSFGGKPTNSEFIALIGDKLQLQLKSAQVSNF